MNRSVDPADDLPGENNTSREQVELLKTNHVAFRPIDVKTGPDGAIYIADWYNPIIQHGEVNFRDPRRDHTHGRIWRVTAKNRPLEPRQNLVGATVPELFISNREQLSSPFRHAAKKSHTNLAHTAVVAVEITNRYRFQYRELQ